MQSDGDMNTEVNTRTHCGWSNWRKMPCVLCDKLVPPHVKGKVYTMIVRAVAARYAERDGDGAKISSHVKKLQVTEMKMCR